MKFISRSSTTLLVGISLLHGPAGCDAESPTAERRDRDETRSAVTRSVDPGATRLESEGRWMEAASRYRELALAGAPPANEASIRQALNAYYMADSPADGEKFAAEILLKWPDLHEVVLYLADLQRVTMRYDEAQRTIERFLEQEPEHVQGTLVSALILVALGETERGLEALEKYLEHGETDPVLRAEAEVVRVRTLRRLGRHRDAADAVTRLLESRPLDPVVLAEAAQTFALQGNTILSRAASQQHLWLSRRGHRLTVEDPLTLYRSGPRPEGEARLALQARDRHEFLRAIEGLRSLVERDPGDPKLAYLLGRLWLRLGRHRECRDVLDVLAKRRVPPTSDVLHLRALLFKRQGMAREASDAWRRALEWLSTDSRGTEAVGEGAREGFTDPSGKEHSVVESPTTVFLSAADHHLETDGDLDRVSSWYAAAAQLSPENPRPMMGEIRIAIRKRELDRAEALLGQLGARVDPKTSEDYLRLDATLRGLRGDLRFAARQLTSLIVKNPTEDRNFAAFMRVFGDKRDVPEVVQIMQLRDQWRKKRRAVEDATKQVAARPLEESASAYHRLGLLAMEMRDRDRALDAFAMAAELNHGSTESLKAALKVLHNPSDVFMRLHSMRRILQRQPDDEEILELLARTYLQLGVRLGEAERIAARLASLKPGPAGAQLLKEARARKVSKG